MKIHTQNFASCKNFQVEHILAKYQCIIFSDYGGLKIIVSCKATKNSKEWDSYYVRFVITYLYPSQGNTALLVFFSMHMER